MPASAADRKGEPVEIPLGAEHSVATRLSVRDDRVHLCHASRRSHAPSYTYTHTHTYTHTRTYTTAAQARTRTHAAHTTRVLVLARKTHGTKGRAHTSRRTVKGVLYTRARGGGTIDATSRGRPPRSLDIQEVRKEKEREREREREREKERKREKGGSRERVGEGRENDSRRRNRAREDPCVARYRRRRAHTLDRAHLHMDVHIYIHIRTRDVAGRTERYYAQSSVGRRLRAPDDTLAMR